MMRKNINISLLSIIFMQIWHVRMNVCICTLHMHVDVYGLSMEKKNKKTYSNSCIFEREVKCILCKKPEGANNQTGTSYFSPCPYYR